MFKVASKCRGSTTLAMLNTRRAVVAHPNLLLLNPVMHGQGQLISNGLL